MRLIDADNTENNAIEYQDKHPEAPLTRGEYKLIENFIYECPTVDAEPVRHGQWIKKSNWQPIIGSTAIKDFPFYECTQCGWSRRFVIDYNYCPNCGAKMGGNIQYE